MIPYFAIFDDKTQSFGPMFPAVTPGAAERSFRESMANPDSPHGKYPEDFALYRILDLDDAQGVVDKTYEPPQLVVRATQLVSKS